VPVIFGIEYFYHFRVKATAEGGANGITANIYIRLVNCFYTVLTLPAYATPQRFGVRDVTDASPI